MKIQKGDMLVQDMNLRIGEVFQIGTGKSAFQMKYAGKVKRSGKTYDKLLPVKD